MLNEQTYLQVASSWVATVSDRYERICMFRMKPLELIWSQENRRPWIEGPMVRVEGWLWANFSLRVTNQRSAMNVFTENVRKIRFKS